MYVFKAGTRYLTKFQSSYLIILLDFLDYQTLVSLLNYWGSEVEYIQNFQCLLHFLLSRIYVPMVNNKVDYLRIYNLLNNLFLSGVMQVRENLENLKNLETGYNFLKNQAKSQGKSRKSAKVRKNLENKTNVFLIIFGSNLSGLTKSRFQV